jgi:hypothetical protein
MARAGFCGTCGENVYLDPDGSCPKGHGADCVSNVYEVPDVAAAPATPVAPVYTAPPAYVTPPPSSSPAVAPPKKKRTGLIVTIVIVVLLLFCGCAAAAGFALFAANSSGSSSSSSSSGSTSDAAAEKPDLEKAKTETAWTFLKGTVIGDPELIKSAMPAETLAVIPDEGWTSFADSSKSVGVRIVGEKWDGAVLTVTTESDVDETVITATPSTPDATSVEFVSVKAGRDPLKMTVKLVDEGGTWKVLALVTPEATIPFDKDGFLNFAGLTP